MTNSLGGIISEFQQSYTKTGFTSTTGKRAAIYARVSTVEQADEGYSIDAQLKILRNICDEKGFELVEEFVDRGISGKDIVNRPGLQAMLQAVEERRLDIVLVWKMNRLSRRITDMLNIVDSLKLYNVEFYSHTDNIDTNTPQGSFQFHIMAAVSEFERKNIAENVKMGMIERAQSGRWNGGVVYGYDIIKVRDTMRKRGDTLLEINPAEAEVVRKIFNLYNQGDGYKTIANRLNHEGHKTKHKREHSINGVKTILMNPLYAGYIRYNVRQEWSTKRRKNINPDPVLVRGIHDPIIDEQTWKRTQELLKGRSRTPNRVHSGSYLLTGIMKCPQCGAGMVLSRTTNKRTNGEKRVLEYYACGQWKNKGSSVCSSNGVRVDKANPYVINRIRELLSDLSLLKGLIEAVNKNAKQEIQPLQKRHAHLVSRLESVERKREKTFSLYEDGMIKKIEVQKRLEASDVDIESLKNELFQIERQLLDQSRLKVDVDVVENVLNNFMELYDKALTVEQQKRLVRILVEEITIDATREIETIQIKINEDVIRFFSNKGGDDPDGSPPPFSLLLNIV
ncbi:MULTISPECIES: recombinase family protein [unclassified Exiguobacterium]|uniref:recombinase family protein n=1 Tax=unclassified Exiguobacterium TaxID=2644629 RepID=UPI0025C2C59D|nr:MULTISPECIES: recombinase family protein [unclassified Exiguobacterium]